MNSKKYKHLTLQDRIEIQEGLFKHLPFRAIAQSIQKDPTTVSKEIKTHAHQHINGFVGTDEICPQLLKAPYVCNGCRKKSSAACHYPRRLYNAKTAQQEYEETLVDSRQGIALNKAEFYENDRIISERLKAGQHIYQILSDVSVSKSSVYRYFQQGYLSASVIDLPRAVKFKPRKSKPSEYVPNCVKRGRTYDDFLAFMEDSELSSYVEMDTVIGRPGGKVILTLHFTAVNFMFGLLLDNKTAAETASKIISFKHSLEKAHFSFGDIFPVILTDNGGEFADVSAFETAVNGKIESNLFFCDPMRSSQKPFIEKNHTLFRDIVPKATSFDSFSQDTVNLIFSHVNSVKRKIFNGKTPFDLMSFLYSEKLLSVFGIKKIRSDKVVQTPILQSSRTFINTLIR